VRSRRIYPVVKRMADIAVAGGLAFVLLPVMFVVAAVVRVFLGSPVLFRQPRPGLNERTFECLKFRTMTDARDAGGQLLPDSQRVSKFGTFLRRTSLDELPQLWSVLTGDMSLVGPRPLMIRYLPRYSAEQRRRHLVRPGITGLAQVSGRNTIDWDRKLSLYGPLLDLKILARTVWIVLTAAGVSKTGQVSMEEFMGNTAK
jgi:lipopolysaccharide/colanic/teichoic acid biosynthesis glycosyltransferase